MNTLSLRMEAVDPKRLTVREFEQINDVTQDMWAFGIGELVQCECCSEVFSKQDIFGHLTKELYVKTVTKIMNIL